MYFLYAEQKYLRRKYEMAFPLSQIADKIKRSVPCLFEHLLKLFYFREDNSAFKWKVSIYKSLASIPKCGNNNKFPSYEFILSAIWSGKFSKENFRKINAGFITGMNNSVKYAPLPRIYNSSQIEQDALKFCEAYIITLAHELSTRGNISSTESFNQLDYFLTLFKYE